MRRLICRSKIFSVRIKILKDTSILKRNGKPKIYSTTGMLRTSIERWDWMSTKQTDTTIL